MSASEKINERRAQILSASERLLKHYGFAKTTVADIAREAGVGVGTVYLEFPSKEAIVQELSARCHAAVLEAMRAATKRPVHYGRQLRELFDLRVEHFLAVAQGGHHAADLVHCDCPAVLEAQQRFRAAELELVAQLLHDADTAGEFTVPHPALTARVIVRVYASFEPPRLYGEPRDGLGALLDATHTLVLSGLLRRGSR